MTYRWTDPAPRAVAAIRQRRAAAEQRQRRQSDRLPGQWLNAQNNQNNWLGSFAPPGAFGCPV